MSEGFLCFHRGQLRIKSEEEKSVRDEIELFPIKSQSKGNVAGINNARKTTRVSGTGSDTRRANNTRGNTGNENNVRKNTLNGNEQKKYTGKRKRQSKKRLRRKRRIKILCGIMGIVILGSFIRNWVKENGSYPGIGGNGFVEFGAKERNQAGIYLLSDSE